MGMSNATARRQLADRGRYLRRNCQACEIVKCSCKAANFAMRRRFSGAIAKPCVNVKRSRKATICQTWKIPACGAIIKPCANAKRSCKVVICRAAKTLRQPHSQPVVAYVHGFPCPQVCFLVSRALSRWQSVITRLPVCALHYKARRRRQGLSAQHDVFSAWGRFSPCHPDRDAALRESLRCHPAAGTARRWRASGGWWPSRSR